MPVKSIQATGTSGLVAGKLFEAVATKRGFALHSTELATKSGKPLRFGVNRIYVNSLDEAADLLARGKHHIRVYNREHRQYNLRRPDKVLVVI